MLCLAKCSLPTEGFLQADKDIYALLHVISHVSVIYALLHVISQCDCYQTK